MITFGAGREKDDPEKAVLPALIFCVQEIDGKRGAALSIGWWDFYARVAVIWSAGRP